MDSHTQETTSLLHFTPTAETRAIIEAASEHADIDSFINACVAKRMKDKQQEQN